LLKIVETTKSDPGSTSHVAGLVFDFRRSVVRRMRLLQISPQMDVNGDRYAHDYQGTDAQNQKPPDHPHSRLG
jgi:hypothetical protein